MTYWDFAVDTVVTAFDACVVWFGQLINAIGLPRSILLFLFSMSAIVGLFILPLRGQALSDTVNRKQLKQSNKETRRLNSGNK